MGEHEKDGFLQLLFPFVFGIYPYTKITPKQRQAMELVGMDVNLPSVYEIAYAGISRLLRAGD